MSNMKNKNNQIRNAILDSRATIFILPKQEIKDAIIKCSDPDINALSTELKSIFLEGKGLAVENKMVADYIEGRLDSKNSKVISMCELRVVEDTVKIN